MLFHGVDIYMFWKWWFQNRPINTQPILHFFPALKHFFPNCKHLKKEAKKTEIETKVKHFCDSWSEFRNSPEENCRQNYPAISQLVQNYYDPLNLGPANSKSFLSTQNFISYQKVKNNSALLERVSLAPRWLPSPWFGRQLPRFEPCSRGSSWRTWRGSRPRATEATGATSSWPWRSPDRSPSSSSRSTGRPTRQSKLGFADFSAYPVYWPVLEGLEAFVAFSLGLTRSALCLLFATPLFFHGSSMYLCHSYFFLIDKLLDRETEGFA